MAKPERIILIRHGQSEGNVNKNIYAIKPDYTLELTKEGRKQALKVGKKLKSIVKTQRMMFYISPFWRTRSTFELLAKSLDKSKIQFREDPRIREQEWGHLRTKKASKVVDLNRDAYGTFYFRIPDGESGADVYDRVTTFMDTLHRDFEKKNFPKNVVIVTHGLTMRLFLMRWFKWSVEEFETIKNPENCGIFVMEKGKNEKYVLKTKLSKQDIDHSYQRPLKF